MGKHGGGGPLVIENLSWCPPTEKDVVGVIIANVAVLVVVVVIIIVVVVVIVVIVIRTS